MEVASMPTASTTQITPERLMQFTFGFAPPLIIEAAIRLHVFNVLDEGAKTIEKLCTETRTSLRGLRAILNALFHFSCNSLKRSSQYTTPLPSGWAKH
jgi:hypothetical protein